MSHLEKERELFKKGIKVLSLFFIDEVASINTTMKMASKKVFMPMCLSMNIRMRLICFLNSFHLKKIPTIVLILKERNAPHPYRLLLGR